LDLHTLPPGLRKAVHYGVEKFTLIVWRIVLTAPFPEQLPGRDQLLQGPWFGELSGLEGTGGVRDAIKIHDGGLAES
jgi:hypothetical protein